jgi:glycosyltransferase involved in cell wall biosynthesis
VTDDPALREVTGDAAETFPPRDPPAIADAVGRLLDDPTAARRRASHALDRCRAMHDITANTRRLEAVYDEALADAVAGG